jgi:hypothetical protein
VSRDYRFDEDVRILDSQGSEVFRFAIRERRLLIRLSDGRFISLGGPPPANDRRSYVVVEAPAPPEEP